MNSLPTTAVTLPSNHVSYYEILGVSQDCTTKDVKSAYHHLLLTHHPDKKAQREDGTSMNGNRHSIQHIQNAYRTLSDEKRRRDYDAALHTHFIKLGLTGTSTATLDTDGIDRIDLSVFEVVESEPKIEGKVAEAPAELEELFVHACPRCRFEDGFVLSETDLEQGAQVQEHRTNSNHADTTYQLLLQCASCSLWICVTYSIS